MVHGTRAARKLSGLGTLLPCCVPVWVPIKYLSAAVLRPFLPRLQTPPQANRTSSLPKLLPFCLNHACVPFRRHLDLVRFHPSCQLMVIVLLVLWAILARTCTFTRPFSLLSHKCSRLPDTPNPTSARFITTRGRPSQRLDSHRGRPLLLSRHAITKRAVLVEYLLEEGLPSSRRHCCAPNIQTQKGLGLPSVEPFLPLPALELKINSTDLATALHATL